MASRTLLFATQGRDAATAKAWWEDLPAHGDKAQSIEGARIDIHHAFINGLQVNTPYTHLTFDWSHMMKMAGEAVDQTRPRTRAHPCAGWFQSHDHQCLYALSLVY